MKLEKRRFCAFIGTALCAALVFAGAALFGQEFPLGESPDLASLETQPFGSYFVVLPSPPILRRGFCIVSHSARGGTTPEQERLAMELERDLTRTRTNAKIEWEAKTKGPADEIFVKTKVKGTLSESQRAQVDAIAASLAAGGEKAKIKIEGKVALARKVLAARAEIGAEQLSALAEIEALGKARFGAAFELPAPRRRYDSLVNAVLLDLPGELVESAKALPGVRDVQPNCEMTPQMDVSVPVTGADLAHLANVKGCRKKCPAGNSKCAESEKKCVERVRVAVIDTGVDYTHPAFQISTPPDAKADNIWTNPGELDEKGRITSGDVTPSSKAPDGCPGRCNVDDDKDGFADLNDPQVKTADYNDNDVPLYGTNSKVDSTPGNCNDLDPINGDDDCDDILRAAADDDEDGFADNFHGVDFGDNDGDPRDDKVWLLSKYHGTHVASIIAGEGCLTGMAPEAQIVAVKIFKTAVYGLPTMADVVDALDWVVNAKAAVPDPRAEIANISLGARCGHPQDQASKAVDSAVLNGVVVVAPSGGGNDLEINSPGTATNAITVTPFGMGSSVNPGPDNDYWPGGAEGYTRYTDPGVPPEDRALFKPDLVAPGSHDGKGVCGAVTTHTTPDTFTECTSAGPCLVPDVDGDGIDDNYVFSRGGEGYGSSPGRSSIAAAHVSGAAALLLGEHPLWTPYFDAGQNQVVNRVKDALVNRPLFDPSTTWLLERQVKPDAGPLGIGSGRLMVKDATETGALDTDFLVRPSLLSFGEVTTCDGKDGPPFIDPRIKTLFVEDLVGGRTFDASTSVEDYPSTPEPVDIAVSQVSSNQFEVELTQTGNFFYPEHKHGFRGEVFVTEVDGAGNPVGDPIRVPWFLAVRNALIRPPGQCQSYAHALQFLSPTSGGAIRTEPPVDVGTCVPGGEEWRVSTCGFSADTKVCFGSFAGGVCTGYDASAIPGSFCPTGGNAGATIDVVVPTGTPGTKVQVVVHDQCTSYNMGTLTYMADDPGASFTHDAPKCVGENVQFTDTSTNFPRQWVWDFGDGKTSTEQSPTHIFTAPGTFTVTLTVRNPCGSYDSFSDTVTMAMVEEQCPDMDGDGIFNDVDNCPLDPNPLQEDADLDGVGDVCDVCPGGSEVDTDLDGTPDCNDGCPLDANKTAPGVCGCGIADTDTDGDGAADCVDNCPLDPNPLQEDADLDGVGDACDTCTDTDGDGLGNPGFPANACATDNCPFNSNIGQEDCDLDGIGDVCDVDCVCCPSGVLAEPSAPGSPNPLLIPTTAANQIIVEDVANETHYVVYEGAIGAWYGTPSRGCLSGADVVDLGATVQLGYSMAPGDQWVVVSAADTAGESSCGTDSAGVEHNAQPGWPVLGPCP